MKAKLLLVAKYSAIGILYVAVVVALSVACVAVWKPVIDDMGKECVPHG